MEPEAKENLEKVLANLKADLPLLKGEEWKKCYKKIRNIKRTLAENGDE